MGLLNEYRPVVSCGRCDKTVSAVVAGQFNVVTDDLGSVAELEQFVLAKCPECSSPFLLIRDGWEDANGERWDDAKTLYPTVSSIVDPSVPQPISRSYAESKTCFESSAYTASSIMCRRTIELICKEKKAPGGNLKERLRALKSSGTLDANIHEWADYVLRDAGNDAAHELEFVAGRDEARDQLDFCRAIIDYVYVFTAAFERFKKRREVIEGKD